MVKLNYILTGVACVGVVATGVLAAKGGVKAHRECVLEKYRKNQGEQEDDKIIELTKKEKFQCSWKAYVPAVAVGAITVGTIIFGEVTHVKTEKSLMAAAAMSTALLERYEQVVRERTDAEVAKEIREEVISEVTGDMMKGFSEDVHTSYSDNKMLCYDPYTETFFRATQIELLNGEIEVNKTLMNGGGTSCAQFLSMFGKHIPETGLGWYMDDGYSWDSSFFGFHNAMMPSLEEVRGREALVIYWSHNPCLPEEDFLCP